MTDSLLHFVDPAADLPGLTECLEPVECFCDAQLVTRLIAWANADVNVQCPGCLARVSKRTGGLQSWEV